MHKTYLGDGVYAQIENGMVRLTTEDGVNTTNSIYLDPQVLQSFAAWMRSITGASLNDM